MSAAHTPGPWYLSEYKGEGVHNIFICAKGSFMTLADMLPIQGEVALVDMNAVHVDTPANARLIAAAPELLEALKGVVAVADRETDEFIRARAVIAKVTP
jgi:hypothetical protein